MKKEILYQGKKICYTLQGSGQTLVLLHGFPMDQRVWNGILPYLQQHFKVITIDLPGFGDSEMIQENHQVELIASVVFEILKAELIEHVVMVGHSMGGYASLAFAAAYPEKLQGLVLFHSHALGDDSKTKENRQKAIDAVIRNKSAFVNSFINGLFDDFFAKQHPEIVKHFTAIAASQKTEAIVAGLMGLRDRKTQLQTLCQLDCPILFILGKNDQRMPFTNILAQLALPKHAELLLLDQVGHMGFAEASEKTQKAIAAFAQRT